MRRARKRRRRTMAGIALWAAAMGACEGYSLTFTDRQPLEPLPVYSEWWAATEECSGRTGTLERIEWYTALSIVGDAAVARGVWSPPHRIVIVRGFEESEPTVRHEMLHDLLAGDAEHTSPLWQACGLVPR